MTPHCFNEATFHVSGKETNVVLEKKEHKTLLNSNVAFERFNVRSAIVPNTIVRPIVDCL